MGSTRALQKASVSVARWVRESEPEMAPRRGPAMAPQTVPDWD